MFVCESLYSECTNVSPLLVRTLITFVCVGGEEGEGGRGEGGRGEGGRGEKRGDRRTKHFC